MAGPVVAAQAGISTLKGLISYGSQAVASRMGYNTMTNIKDNYAAEGTKLMGSFGGSLFGLFGKAVAGSQILPVIQPAVNETAKGLNNLGVQILDAATRPAAPQNARSWTTTALNVAQTVALVGITATAAANLIPVGTYAAANMLMTAVPGIISAATAEVTNDDPDFIDDVAVKFIKQMAIEAISTVAKNVAIYNTVEGAYKAQEKKIIEIGNFISSYLPERFKPSVDSVAKVAAYVDAPVKAMSNENIAKAVANGESNYNISKNTLQAVNVLVNNQVAAPTNGYLDTARKAAWIGAGVLSAAALITLCPEAAAIPVASGLLSVAEQGVRYAKAKWFSNKAPAAPAAQAAAEEQPQGKVPAQLIQEVAAAYRPRAEGSLKLSMAAPAA